MTVLRPSLIFILALILTALAAVPDRSSSASGDSIEGGSGSSGSTEGDSGSSGSKVGTPGKGSDKKVGGKKRVKRFGNFLKKITNVVDDVVDNVQDVVEDVVDVAENIVKTGVKFVARGKCLLGGWQYAIGTEFDQGGFRHRCKDSILGALSEKMACLVDGEPVAPGQKKTVGDATYECKGQGILMTLTRQGEGGDIMNWFNRPSDEIQLKSECAAENCVMLDPRKKPHCDIYGDPHLFTFDGRWHDYQGTCRYTAVKPVDNTGPQFRVSVKSEQRESDKRKNHLGIRVSWVKYIETLAYDQVIRFTRGGSFTVNGVKRTAPYFFPVTEECAPDQPCQMNVMPYGSKGFKLSTDFGLGVSFDGDHQAFVIVDKAQYAGKVTGMCGNFDGNKDNDWKKPDGSNAANFNILGDSWIEEDLETDAWCERFKDEEPKPACSADQEAQAIAMCSVLKDVNGPFKDCSAAMGDAINQAYQNCLFDVCAFDLDEEVRCKSVQTMAAACQKELGHAVAWRAADFCPLECPAGMSYEPCMTPVAATCALPEPDHVVDPDDCVEGCSCAEGTLSDNGQCIDRANCGCLDEDGAYHPKGTGWKTGNCGEECTCKGNGVVECSTIVCPEGATCGTDETTGDHVCKCADGFMLVGDQCVSGTTTAPPAPLNPTEPAPVQVIDEVVEEEPVTEEPVEEEPAKEEPVEEEPAAEEPTEEEPIEEIPFEGDPTEEELFGGEPAVEEPVKETGSKTGDAVEPDVEEPVKEEPAVEEPVIVGPAVEELAIVEPAVEEPAKVEPAVEEPAKVEPAVEEPAKVEPAVEEPAIVEPAVEEPAKVEPAVEEPAKVEPAVEEPAKVEPAVEEPAKVEPAVEEPAKVEPAEEEPPTTEEDDDNEPPATCSLNEEFSGGACTCKPDYARGRSGICLTTKCICGGH